MKRMSVTLAIVGWMLMATTVLAGPKTPAAPKNPPPEKLQPLPQAYQWMKKELNLVETQQNQIANLWKNDNVQKIQNELLKVENDKIAAAKTELAVATKDKDADGIKAARAKMAEAQANKAPAKIRPKVCDKIEGEMMTVLTAEQKTKWAVHAALPGVAMGLRPVALTQEQVTKVRGLCEAQSTALLAAWGSEKVDEWKGVIKGIVDDAKANVLSEQQQKQLPKEKTPPPAKVQ